MSLFLIDGHALAYRSYYAFAARPLINSKGEETSAVYGFLGTVLQIIDRHRPTHLAVCFDASEHTFRHDMFPEYKAQRDAMPESLRAQLPVIMAMLDAMQIPHVAIEGYEADDIIATMAAQWKGDTPVAIVSGDKDLLQLVDERVHVIRPGKGGVLENEIGPEDMVRVIGLKPHQMVDYLSLMGDSSDNVPGVRGIGEKTARKLLQEFGSLDAVYERVSEVSPPGVKKKLKGGREQALLSRKLVTLDSSVPLDLELGDLARNDHRTRELNVMLEELEFNRLARQLFTRADSASRAGHATPEGNFGTSSVTPGAASPASASAPAIAPAVAAGDVDVKYERVDTEPLLRAMCDRINGMDMIAVDVETSGLDPMRSILAGVAIASRPGRAWYVPITSRIDGGALTLFSDRRSPGLELDVVRRHLGPILAAPRPVKVGQNIKFDEIVLVEAGMPLGGVAFDTMLASYCLDAARRSHGLDALAQDVCHHEMIPFASLFDTRSREKDIRTVSLDRVVPYACEDADYTLRIRDVFAPMIAASSVRALFEDIEMPLRDLLRRMEMTGVRVNIDFLSGLSQEYAVRIKNVEAEVYRLAGEPFNVNSTQMLRQVLFDKLGLKPTRKTKTGFSTDADVLSGLTDAHPIVAHILEYRQLVKLQTTYIDALPRLVHPVTGRVHTSYNQAVTTTGRLSSSDPNLQNIPIRTAEGREIRRAFVPLEPGHVLLDADYSQIELRILAHLSGDRELIQAFHDDADVHRRTAARIMGLSPDAVSDEMRSRAKTVNFGIIYGMGARGLASSLGIPVDEARAFIDEYFKSYPGVKRFIDDTIQRAREERVTTTMLGRVRRLPDIESTNNRARAFSERIAVNTPVQGTAADIIKLAMLEADGRIRTQGLRSRMIIQVHDELLFDVPQEELNTMKVLVRESMETALDLVVPLKVDMGTGQNWLEAH